MTAQEKTRVNIKKRGREKTRLTLKFTSLNANSSKKSKCTYLFTPNRTLMADPKANLALKSFQNVPLKAL